MHDALVLKLLDAIGHTAAILGALLIFGVLLGGCSTTGGQKSSGNISSTGSVDWNWNQTPHGGSDEKSSSAPVEPAS